MLDAIKHGLSNLFNPNGRDARQAFWYYVLFIYLLTMAISMVVIMPVTMQSVMTGVQQGIEAGRGQDPAAAQAAVQASMLTSMSQIFPAMMWVSMITGIIMLVGLGASFVRRLHDSGLSSYWALLPAACQIVSLAAVPSQLTRIQESIQSMDLRNPLAGFAMMQGSFGIGPLLAWAAIGIVVALGVRKSMPGPNRFGDAPFVA